MRALRVSSLPAAGFGFTVFSSFSFLQAVFALVGPVHLRVRARCARHHLLSVSAFLPSTRCYRIYPSTKNPGTLSSPGFSVAELAWR